MFRLLCTHSEMRSVSQAFVCILGSSSHATNLAFSNEELKTAVMTLRSARGWIVNFPRSAQSECSKLTAAVSHLVSFRTTAGMLEKACTSPFRSSSLIPIVGTLRTLLCPPTINSTSCSCSTLRPLPASSSPPSPSPSSAHDHCHDALRCPRRCPRCASHRVRHYQHRGSVALIVLGSEHKQCHHLDVLLGRPEPREHRCRESRQYDAQRALLNRQLC